MGVRLAEGKGESVFRDLAIGELFRVSACPHVYQKVRMPAGDYLGFNLTTGVVCSIESGTPVILLPAGTKLLVE